MASQPDELKYTHVQVDNKIAIKNHWLLFAKFVSDLQLYFANWLFENDYVCLVSLSVSLRVCIFGDLCDITFISSMCGDGPLFYARGLSFVKGPCATEVLVRIPH